MCECGNQEWVDKSGEGDTPQPWRGAESRIMNLVLKLLFRERGRIESVVGISMLKTTSYNQLKSYHTLK